MGICQLRALKKNLFAATEHLFDSVYQTDVLSEDGCWCIKESVCVCCVGMCCEFVFGFLYVCVCLGEVGVAIYEVSVIVVSPCLYILYLFCISCVMSSSWLCNC